MIKGIDLKYYFNYSALISNYKTDIELIVTSGVIKKGIHIKKE